MAKKKEKWIGGVPIRNSMLINKVDKQDCSLNWYFWTPLKLVFMGGEGVQKYQSKRNCKDLENCLKLQRRKLSKSKTAGKEK